MTVPPTSGDADGPKDRALETKQESSSNASREHKPGYKVPPIEHQIQPGEKRNVHGRRGKPSLAPLPKNEFTEILDRVLESNGERTTLRQRIAHRAILSAATGDMRTARWVVEEDRRARAAEDAKRRQFEEIATDHVKDARPQFEAARLAKRRPPDITPHPDHFKMTEDGLKLLGPLDQRARFVWEFIKRRIANVAKEHASLRDAVARQPGCKELTERLREVEKERRMLMRLVPQGWNWRENIKTCDTPPKDPWAYIKWFNAGCHHIGMEPVHLPDRV